MDELLKLNEIYFKKQKDDLISLIYVEKIVKKLNKHNIVKINGLFGTKKLETIYGVAKLLGKLDEVFYFNPEVYKNAKIKNSKGLSKLFSVTSENNNNKKTTIVLDNVDGIKDIKNFISEKFSTKKYKIILIGSLKSLGKLPTVLIPTNSLNKTYHYHLSDEDFFELSKYGTLHNLSQEKSDFKSVLFRDAIKNSIILENIIIANGLKDVNLYNSTISLLSRNVGKYLSIREINISICDSNLKTSVITTTEYITSSVNAGLLYRVLKYDLKKDTILPSKGTFYFGDLGMLSSFSKDTALAKNILLENIILLELIIRGYEVNSGVNGKFNFSFYTKKLGEKKLIHVSTNIDKKEIKKDINKLAKIKLKAKKYIVVYSLEELNLRKKDYEDVQLINWYDLVQSL